MKMMKTTKNLMTLVLSIPLFLCSAMPALAVELDEHCTVNIMNRTVQIQADGSWRMDNVPAFMGRVRARATCVNNGVTSSGQSEFFTLTNNNTTVVEGIFFDDPDAIPVALRFDNAENIALSSNQLTAALSVRAAFSDGSFSPELNASNGINFISSNPAIIAVDENGRLQANSSGRVLITARLEGAVASVLVTAALSGDRDGDGLPDSYELANGLDPNDAVDALEDRDNDGLNALAEFAAGTDVNSNDSDGDDINDGEELVAGLDGFITNPLLADSDGDGIADGLEVDLATNPNDALSFDLANALESITVAPHTLTLIFNGVDTEVSDTISVTGHLIDGSTMDITASTLGTTYQSADLTIASFGVNDGEIFGGLGGSTTITASNSGYSDTITVNVERFNPVALSAIDIPGYANNVDIQGNYAYVAAGSAGLVIVDVTDRRAPFIAAQLDTDGTAIDVKVSGNSVYLADGEMGVKIIDVLDPLNPLLVSELDTDGFAQDIDVDSQHLYAADGDNGLVVVNIVQKETPFIESSLSGIGRAKGVAVESNRIAIASTVGLVLVDASNIASLQETARGMTNQGRDVLLQGNYVYLSAYTTGYQVIDVTDMSNPIVVAGDRQIVPRDAVIQDNLLLFAEQLFPNVVAYMNIADPDNTVFQGTINLSPFGDYAGTGIAADNQYAYITEESFVVRNDYGISGVTKLFIAQYRQITDNQGVAPSVNIISPEGDAHIAQGSTLTIDVNAVDDLSVKEVEFSINGEVLFVDTGAPFSMVYHVPENIAGLIISVKAEDWGGNAATTERYIEVLPDADRDTLSDEAELTIYFTDPNDPDTDGDTLMDYREILLGTDPNQMDSDADTIPDGLEVANGTNPLLADTDGDGLSDAEEITHNTDALRLDTDSDGLSDGEELNTYFTDPLLADTDGDTLSDGDEVNRYQTNPINMDSDGDTYHDNIEISLGADPNAPQDDVDGDELPDEQEIIYGTDPIVKDTDGDGLFDGAEVARRLNPLKRDTDSDGINDAQDTVNEWHYFFDQSYVRGMKYVVGGAGDINGDGVPDIVVGISSANSTKVFSGIDGKLLYEFANSGGYAVSGAGDVNNDGFSDVVVGSPYTGGGIARVFSGVDGAVLYTLEPIAHRGIFGFSVSGAGDVNGDGFDDIIVGDYSSDNNGYDSGSASVFSGIDGSVLYTFNGDSSGDKFGSSVSYAGDVNNDGFADMIVGFGINYTVNTTGGARVFSGVDGSIIYSFFGSGTNAFGISVSDAGDVNGDGFADVIVGASSDINSAGRVGSATVFSGIDGSIVYKFYGDAERDYFGSSVSSAGDVNGDGITDIIVGAKVSRYVEGYRGRLANNVGSATLFSGADGTVIHTFYGLSENEYLGSSLASVGDINGDGLSEIVLGSNSTRNVFTSISSSARVISFANDWDQDGVVTLEDPYPETYMDPTTDYDSDGLLDFVEIELGTHALEVDSDNDGISDGDEVNVYSSNPLSSDSDSDGIPDKYEVDNFLNPTDASDINGDQDGDEISNLQEFLSGTLAGNPDTDGDGLNDLEEPTIYRTDPLLVDTDGDGVNDASDIVNEWYYFFNNSLSSNNAGDVNGDGVNDIIVNFSLDTRYFLSAKVLSGVDGSILHIFNADSYVDGSGFKAINGAGDVNGDGFADLIVGAQYSNERAHFAGSATVFSGKDGSILHRFMGASEEDFFGAAVSGAGDVNGDGFDDVIIGAPNDNTNNRYGRSSGSAYVFSGVDGSILHTLHEYYSFNRYDNFGSSVNGLGDINGDGFADIIVGIEGDNRNGPNSGSARIFSGADGSILHSFYGDSEEDRFGSSVNDAGDVNKDGVRDIIIGAGKAASNVSAPRRGSAYIYSGANGSLLYQFDDPSPQGSDFGGSVSGAGDMNGDGFVDVAVGARCSSNNSEWCAGSVTIFSGFNGDVIHTFYGYSRQDYLGSSVAALGDINGDGLTDIVVGADGSRTVRVLSLYDWDGDGTPTLNDPYPYIYMDNESDYDSDGLLDVVELMRSTDVFNSDTDGDGLIDGDEVNLYLSDPLLIDSDSDSMPDKFEVDNSLNPIDASDTILDADNDGLDNLTEYRLGTSPNNSDTDGDNLLDSYEIANRTSPLRSDTDGDGVPDATDTLNDWYHFLRLDVGDSPSYTNRVSVSPLGDINLDGVIDFIVGSTQTYYFGASLRYGPMADVKIISGLDLQFLHEINGPSFSGFGKSVSGLGDINGDDIPDFIVGAPSATSSNGRSVTGSATVYSGADFGILFSLEGDSSSDRFGSSVANAGDLNNDGVNDILVGSPLDDNNFSNSGSVKAFSGMDGGLLYTLNGEAVNESFGYSVDSVNDIDGDGYSDIVIGSYQRAEVRGSYVYGIHAGLARVFSGADGSLIYRFNPEIPNTGVGSSVSRAGDVDGDGYEDIILGVPFGDDNGSNSGSVKIYSGADGSLINTLVGDSAGDLLGSSVANAGDVNNDGFADVVVSATYDGSDNSYLSGSVRVYSGIDGSTLYTIYGTESLDFQGEAISYYGDIDQDGYDEIIISDRKGAFKIISINTDWDNDGVITLDDAEPLNPAVQ